MSLHHLTVRTRLGLGFGLLILLLVCVMLAGLVQLAGFNDKVEALANVRLGQMVTLTQAGNVIGQDMRSTGNVLLLDDEKLVKGELQTVRNNQGAVRELLVKLERS